MYPLNDKDLDRLSRDAAEQFDVEPSASGWEQLEQRLDKELPIPTERDRRRFIFWIFLAALLSGGGLIGMLTSNNKIAADKTITKVTNTTPDAALPAATETNTPTGETTATTNKTKTTEKAKQPDSEINSTEKPEVAANTTTGKTNSIKDKAVTQQHVTSNTEKKQKSVKRIPFPTSNPFEKDVVVNDKNDTRKKPADKIADVKTVDEPVTNSTTEEPLKTVAGDPTNTVTEKNEKPVTPPVTETAKKEDKEQPVATKEEPARKKTAVSLKQPLEFGLVAGPDFTNVNFRKTYKSGFNAGITVAYRFNNRWSVNTGLIYTKKNYSAVGDDFHSPKHYWINYVDLEKVQGNCSMWEIPVNVRYDFSVTNKNRLFFNTGLSTYLMGHEYYDYYYTYQGSALQKGNWQSDSTKRYYFSVLNLSAGFEHAVSKQISIQAEPFLKVPLKGLGFGSMNLDSYGIYFTLKYKPVWGKK